MSTSTCFSCHNVLQIRLRSHIAHFQYLRRSYHATPKSFSHETLSWYGETTPPTEDQLAAASKFFGTHPPRKLWTATEWRKQKDGNTSTLTPEVAFLGRSNVGKSSLLNALVMTPQLNHVGPRPGKTTTMHAWAIAPTDPKTGGAVKGMGGDMETKFAVLDMPGYGYASHGDWGEEIMAYLRNRKQLRRAFILMDSTHGVKPADEFMLKLLRKEGIPHQIIASKCDRLGSSKTMGAAMKDAVSKLWAETASKATGPGLSVLGEILVVGSLGDGRKNDKVKLEAMKGVGEVQWAVLRAAGLDSYAMQKAFPSKPNGKAPQISTHSISIKEAREALDQSGTGSVGNKTFSITDIIPNTPLTPAPSPSPQHLRSDTQPSSASRETPPRSPTERVPQSRLEEIIALALAGKPIIPRPRETPTSSSLPFRPSSSPPSHILSATPPTATPSSVGRGIDALMSMTQKPTTGNSAFPLPEQSTRRSRPRPRASSKFNTPSPTPTPPKKPKKGPNPNSMLGQLQVIYNHNRSHNRSGGVSRPFTPGVGGMADLEALSTSRNGEGGGRSISSSKSTSKSKAPSLTSPQSSRQLMPLYWDQAAPSAAAKKIAVSRGPFTPGVGRMADLEALSSRDGPKGKAGEGSRKRRKRA